MFNPRTKNIVETRDVQWADWHGGPKGKPEEDLNEFMSIKAREEEKTIIVPNNNSTTLIDDMNLMTNSEGNDNTNENGTSVNHESVNGSKSTNNSGNGWNTESIELSSMSETPPVELSSSSDEEVNYAKMLMEIDEEDVGEKVTTMHTALIALTSDSGEPTDYDEAMNCPEKESWRHAAEKETKHFKERGVYEVTKFIEGQIPKQKRS